MLQPTIFRLAFQPNLNFVCSLDGDTPQYINDRLSHKGIENCTLVITKALEGNLQLVAWMPQSHVI